MQGLSLQSVVALNYKVIKYIIRKPKKVQKNRFTRAIDVLLQESQYTSCEVEGGYFNRFSSIICDVCLVMRASLQGRWPTIHKIFSLSHNSRACSFSMSEYLWSLK